MTERAGPRSRGSGGRGPASPRPGLSGDRPRRSPEAGPAPERGGAGRLGGDSGTITVGPIMDVRHTHRTGDHRIVMVGLGRFWVFHYGYPRPGRGTCGSSGARRRRSLLGPGAVWGVSSALRPLKMTYRCGAHDGQLASPSDGSRRREVALRCGRVRGPGDARCRGHPDGRAISLTRHVRRDHPSFCEGQVASGWCTREYRSRGSRAVLLGPPFTLAAAATKFDRRSLLCGPG